MKKHLQSSILILLVLTATFTCSLPAQEKPVSHQDTITLEELRDHIYFLASDYLKGRSTGSEGYLIAAQYTASQLREAGLKTVCKDADGKETYFQQVEIVNQKYGDKQQASLWIEKNETALNNGESVLVINEGGGVLERTESVFLGYGIEEPEEGWNDYSTIDPTGKVVFVVPGAPTEEGKPVLPQNLHNKYAAMNSLVSKINVAIGHKAAAIVVVLPGQFAMLWEGISQQFNREKMVLKDATNVGALPAPMPVLLMHPSAAAKAFEGISYNPVRGEGECKPIELSNVQVSIGINKELSQPISSPNVVGLVEGNDPELKDQYIVVSAHLDHQGVQGGEIYNGADDNGSGVAAVLEAAEAAAMSNPRRSILFALFVGEEEGSLGAQYFIENPPVPFENIILNINADMVGRNSPAYPTSLLLLVSTDLAPGLLEFVKELNETKVKADLDFSLNDKPDPLFHLQRSDQFTFFIKGIPIVLVTRGFSEPNYHHPSDDPETVNYIKVQQASRMMYEMAMEIANSDTLPWKDK